MPTPKSKFGGIPVDEAPKSKFGGIPVAGFDPDDFMAKRQAAPAGGAAFDPDEFMAKRQIPTFEEFKTSQTGTAIPSFEDFKAQRIAAAAPPSLMPGTPNSDAAGRFASNFAGAINPIPGLAQMATEAVDPKIGLRSTLGRHLIDPQTEQFGKSVDAVKGTGEFEHMSPLSRASSAFGHGLAGALPLIGPAAANAGDQIGSGDVAGGFGSGAGLIATMDAPRIMRGGGRVLMRGAEPFAENSMGIRNIDRKFGRTPGRAILDETTGFSPGATSESAGNVIKAITPQRNAILGASSNKVDFRPALNEATGAIDTARSGNSDSSHLEPMVEQLTRPRPGFTGNTTALNAPPPGTTGPSGPTVISLSQDPLNALAMRQRFGNDYTKFDAAKPVSNEARAVGNRVYGKMTDAIHTAVPESAPFDQRISNLIPARDAGSIRGTEPGLGASVLKRIGARTGALGAGAIIGSHFGDPLLGTALGVGVPEVLAHPTTQMIAARGLNGFGKGLRSPITGRSLQVAPNLKERRLK